MCKRFICVAWTSHNGSLYLMKSSFRRSLLTARASRTSSRICRSSWLSSAKDCGSGSRPLSVRNFNRTVETEEREEEEQRNRREKKLRGWKLLFTKQWFPFHLFIAVYNFITLTSDFHCELSSYGITKSHLDCWSLWKKIGTWLQPQPLHQMRHHHI